MQQELRMQPGRLPELVRDYAMMCDDVQAVAQEPGSRLLIRGLHIRILYDPF